MWFYFFATCFEVWVYSFWLLLLGLGTLVLFVTRCSSHFLQFLVKVLHQPKSGGVENRSREMRVAARNASVHKVYLHFNNIIKVWII